MESTLHLLAPTQLSQNIPIVPDLAQQFESVFDRVKIIKDRSAKFQWVACDKLKEDILDGQEVKSGTLNIQ